VVISYKHPTILAVDQTARWYLNYYGCVSTLHNSSLSSYLSFVVVFLTDSCFESCLDTSKYVG
jgi:hypothetical protein